jgi:hypothetical protein
MLWLILAVVTVFISAMVVGLVECFFTSRRAMFFSALFVSLIVGILPALGLAGMSRGTALTKDLCIMYGLGIGMSLPFTMTGVTLFCVVRNFVRK